MEDTSDLAPPIPVRGGEGRLLEAPVRRQLLDVVARHPGLPVGELQARLGVGWGTLHHHLLRLEDAGLVRTRLVGRRRLVHLRGSGGAHAGHALLRGRSARRVALAIAERPRSVYSHVKRLVEARLVTAEGQTRYERLAPTPLLLGLLHEAPEVGDWL